MATFTEMETDEKQRSRGNFNYGGYSSGTTVLDNQLDFSATVPSYVSQSSYSPSTSTYEQTSSYEETTPSYQVETEYNFEKLPEDEIIVPTFMPTLDRPAPVREESREVKIKLNSRGKIALSAFGVIVGILIAFMVYNAVVISGLSNQLAYLEVEKQSITASVAQSSLEYQELTSYDNIDMKAWDEYGMGMSNPANDKTMSIKPRPEIKETKIQGNWFDSVCEFFSNLF